MSQEQHAPSLKPSLAEQLSRPVRTINGYVLTALAFFLVACVVWQVISRYTSARPSTVTDELARFTFMWIGLLGAAQACAYKKHLGIELITIKFKGKAKTAINIFIELCIMSFACLVMIKGGWQLAMKTFASQQVTPALQWSMGYVYMVEPIAGALIVFFALMSIIENLSAPQGGEA